MAFLKDFITIVMGRKKNHNDMDIIKQIEKQIGKKLKQIPLNEIWKWRENCCVISNTELVMGVNLDNCKLKDISFLRDLSGLTHLSLRQNQLTDLTPLSAMMNLTVLYLGENQLTHLTPLSAMRNLTRLDLGNNQLTDLTPLCALRNLTVLYLGGNQLTALTPLRELTKLTELGLNNNELTDLTPLRELTELTELGLKKNQLTDLRPLNELKFLRTLDVRNNRIRKLPPDITTWWPGMELRWDDELCLEDLNLYGNPLTNPPAEIVKQGKKAVENYFAEIQQASVHFLECKLLLIGSGDVGKTTLMKKLKDNTFEVLPGKEDTTRGIEIQTWQLACSFPVSEIHDVNIHFWDFAGQDILHATHQFFLTKRSLYLFVWDPRKEEAESFDYWLNAVKLFGAGSPLIMVMNKADIRTKNIDEASFHEKFPDIVRFHQVSCVSGQHITELTETIRSALCEMSHLLDKLPKRWMDIRNDLKARAENYISLEDYFALCLTHGMPNEKALFLSEYLHDLGIILHFHQDPVLSGTVILKPEWATGAVYALIDSLEIQQKKGRFNYANLARYWDKDKYPPEKYPQLLRLIEKFELCFNIVGTDEYILPELLPSQRPAMAMKPYRPGGILQLHYIYEFMPAGIITRFISRIHYLIKDDHYWNTGVELHFSGSSALVVGDTVQKRIRISVTGDNNTQLIGIIRSHFEHIHRTLNMNKEEHVFEEVPCICPQCLTSGKPHYYNYNFLQKLIAKGSNVHCVKSVESVSIAQLIHGLLPPKETGTLFNNLVTVSSQLQEIKKTLQPDENSRNTVLALLLQTRGFCIKNQALSGLSASGDSIGELDIKVIDRETGRAVSIIEALRLNSCNNSEIDRHVTKLLKHYDPSGLKENYILVYASVKDFNEFCRKYREHIFQIDYSPYPLKNNSNPIDKPETGFEKIIAYRGHHHCNQGETILYHLLVEM